MSKIVVGLLIGISLLTSNLYAQMPGGSMSPPDFNAEKAAGIFTYNLDQVIKKLKLTDQENQNKAKEALKRYNSKMDKLSLEHAYTFKELDDAFDKNIQRAMQRRDRSQMNGVKAQIQEIIPPIKMQVTAEETILNDSMLGILTEKQNQKWLKYQKQKKG